MITIPKTPECGEALVIFEDNNEEDWAISIPKPGQIHFLDPKGIYITSTEKLIERKVKKIYITTYTTIEV